VAVGIGQRVGAGIGTLYVVATPIGNLSDLSPRAAEVLRTVAAVAAEDTRRTLKLYAHLGAAPPRLVSLPAFDERGRLGPIVELLLAGRDVALCTDAGTPSVSDPGRRLVAAAWEAGARVVPVPGPCAAVAALSAAGLPGERFLVVGFLPRKGAARARELAWMSGIPATLVIYEAGNRAAATLADLLGTLGDRQAALARELTKLHEEIARGRLSELLRRFPGEVRGEVTLVVAGAIEFSPGRPAPDDLDDELKCRLAAGEPPSEIARTVARARGLPRREVYARIESLKRGDPA
jgi:16S rRNA (cytidine1402-2'-O)-methyltransferase